MLFRLIIPKNFGDFFYNLLPCQGLVLLFYRVPDAGEGSVVWKEFDTMDRNYLDFSWNISLKQNANPDTVDFWLRQMPTTNMTLIYSIGQAKTNNTFVSCFLPETSRVGRPEKDLILFFSFAFLQILFYLTHLV